MSNEGWEKAEKALSGCFGWFMVLLSALVLALVWGALVMCLFMVLHVVWPGVPRIGFFPVSYFIGLFLILLANLFARRHR